MPQNDTPPQPRPRGRLLLRRSLLVLAVTIVFCAFGVAALPVLVSSDFGRARVEAALSEATGKPATLRVLAFSWTRGLRLEGLRIGAGGLDDPAFLASLDSLQAHADLLSLLRKDLRLDLALRGLRLRVPRPSQAAPAPPAQPLHASLRQAFDALRAGLEPKALAANAHLDLDIADVALRLEHNGKPLTLRLDFLRLNAPDLKAAPAELSAQAEIAPQDAAPLPLRLAARLDSLADASGRIAPAGGRLDADLDAPGLTLAATGSLAAGLDFRTRLDLRKALAAAAPLAPRPLPETDGTLGLDITLRQPAPERLDVTLALKVEALRVRAASPGGAPGKAIGPLDAALRQEARLDLAGRGAELPGALELGPSGRLPWTASLADMDKDALRLGLRAGPARLELGPLLAAARAFLPPGLAIAGLDLSLERLRAEALAPASGALPGVDLDLAGLALSLRGLQRRDASGTLRLNRAELAVPTASVRLPAPRDTDSPAQGNATLTVTAALAGLGLDGAAPVRLDSAGVEALRLDASGLRPVRNALYGVAGRAHVEFNAAARGLEAKGRAFLPELKASAVLDASLPEEKRAEAVLRHFALDAPLLRLLQPGKKPVETPLGLRASAEALRLAGGQPTVPGVEGLRLTLELGKALRCEANADLTGPQGRSLRADGRLGLDLPRLLALGAGFAPRGAKALGSAGAEWRVAAELPAAQPGPRTGPPPKPSDTVRSLAFLHEADLLLRLDGVGVDWPRPAPATPLVLRGLSTPQPLRLTTRNGLGESRLSGSVSFGPMSELPGLPPLPRPASGLLRLDATQQGARSAQVTQTLRVEGLGLDQSLILSLDRLDALLDRLGDLPAAALERADATAAFRLAADLRGLAEAAGAGRDALTGAGRLEAATDLRLSGGRSLELSTSLKSPGLHLRAGDALRLEGLTADLRLARRFALTPGLRCPGDTEEPAVPLSEQVFDQLPALATARERSEALGQLLDSGPATARGRGGSLGLDRLRLRAGGLPLDIRDLRLVLDDSGPLPGLRSFRAGLLGGNVLGGARLRRDAAGYGLSADLAFTGIDPGRLLPDKAPKDLGDRAEAAGRLSLFAPLAAEPEALLQRLELRADLTKIGPRTLERLLYALDPEEKNEAVVQQRRLMGIGHPRWLRVAAAYGNLAVSGAVDVKGFQLDLPQIDRLPLANLPLRKQLARPLAAVPGLVRNLDAASGSRICREPRPPQGTGALRFLQSP